MCGLWATVVAYNSMGEESPGEEIGDATFACISKSQIGDEDCLFFMVHSVVLFSVINKI
jgi:hypothetical protein